MDLPTGKVPHVAILGCPVIIDPTLAICFLQCLVDILLTNSIISLSSIKSHEGTLVSSLDEHNSI